jgi:arginyl-tRNA synthetase
MRNEINSLINSFEAFLGEGTLSREDLARSVKPSANPRFGDLSFQCHDLAGVMEHDYKGGDKDIAKWVAEEMQVDPSVFESISVAGPFVNFRLNQFTFVDRVLDTIAEQGPGYGSLDIGTDQTIVVDYSAPNIGKPLHIGHIRSTVLGDSMVRIWEKAGYSTHGINYLGDIGLHIGKIISAYRRHLDEDALQADPEKELARLYVKFGEEHDAYVAEHKDDLEDILADSKAGLQESPEEEENSEQVDSPYMREAKEILLQLEQFDPEVTDILDRIHKLSMQSFDEIYALLGVTFDETTGQSHFSDKGRAIILKGLEEGVAEVDDTGATLVNLDQFDMASKVVLKSDGAALYSTQDIGAAQRRWDQHHFDKLVYVVAEEQNDYFRRMFRIFEVLGNEGADRCHHLTFGMINLDEGKMSSRKGNVVYLRDVLNESMERARSCITGTDLSEPERDEIARVVGIGAMKYMVLGVDPVTTMSFSWDKAFNLKANSSPYIQYAHARACSLIGDKDVTRPDKLQLNHPTEIALVKKLAEYDMQVERAAESMKPSVIANYAHGLAKAFSSFYNQVKVAGTDEEESRLYLTDCFKTVVSDSLGLLGIEAPSKM